jgi:cellulose synthase/poly-beta-1,6-N-acetylglucosamine synthase-like glycosyltransferase
MRARTTNHANPARAVSACDITTRSDLESMLANTVPHKLSPRIVALIPAHNEQEDIGNTIQSLLDQTRRLDDIIVISDNSTDWTVVIANLYGVRVIETEGNTHRKSGALNMAWNKYCQTADIIICADGDTTMPPHAVADWEAEFANDPQLGGSSSQPIMTGKGYLPRLQRYEFAKSATQTLSRGWCRVISGTGCAFRNIALQAVAARPNQEGPWTYESVVEDYHLTYRLRQKGWKCWMSETVFCYTGSMKTWKSLWYQRIKWEAGTCGDLLRFGCNRLNYREWLQRGFLFMNISFWMIWTALNGTEAIVDPGRFNWKWQLLTGFLMLVEFIHVRRIRGHDWARDWKDTLLAVLLVHMIIYNLIAIAWGVVSWYKVLSASMGDLWAPQYKAEGMQAEAMKVGIDS